MVRNGRGGGKGGGSPALTSGVVNRCLGMRTTLTLDDDLAQRLRALAPERGITLRQAANEVLRLGLAEVSASGGERFRIEPCDLGELLVPDLDCTGAILRHLDEDGPKQA